MVELTGIGDLKSQLGSNAAFAAGGWAKRSAFCALAALVCFGFLIDPVMAVNGDGAVTKASETVAVTARRLYAAALTGLDRHPAAMLALFAGAILPVLAIAASVTRASSRVFAARRHQEVAAAPVVARGFDVAWIERDGTDPTRIGELTRIGSVDDCELAVAPPVAGADHMLHAVIQRTPEREFIVFDVAPATDRNLTVNGEPAAARRLSDGDEIAVGSDRFVFRLGRGIQAPHAIQYA